MVSKYMHIRLVNFLFRHSVTDKMFILNPGCKSSYTRSSVKCILVFLCYIVLIIDGGNKNLMKFPLS